jgi:hypothetical protein
MPRRSRSAGKRGPEGERMIDGASFRLAGEIRTAEDDGHVVTIGQLTSFSGETGGAWIIDRDDRLTLWLARQGDPNRFTSRKPKLRLRSNGRATIAYAGRTTTVIGYPPTSSQQPMTAKFQICLVSLKSCLNSLP